MRPGRTYVRETTKTYSGWTTPPQCRIVCQRLNGLGRPASGLSVTEHKPPGTDPTFTRLYEGRVTGTGMHPQQAIPVPVPALIRYCRSRTGRHPGLAIAAFLTIRPRQFPSSANSNNVLSIRVCRGRLLFSGFRLLTRHALPRSGRDCSFQARTRSTTSQDTRPSSTSAQRLSNDSNQ